MEALPEHPAWDLEWRNITEDNTATLEAVTDVIGEHGYGIDKLIHSLLWAAKISSDQGMKKPTYALVGPMGAGTCTGDELREPSDFSASKSSVLNAMLDKSIAVVAGLFRAAPCIGDTALKLLECANMVDVPGFDDTDQVRVTMAPEALRDSAEGKV
nr:hypothetical protein B0A51_01300 [Rachicladosporium sp. CCFEE 5018]